MAFSLIKFLKGIVITEEGTLTPREVEILPGGTANTKTTIQASQTANQTVTLPDATDTLVGKATTDTLTNKTIDGDTNTIQDVALSSLKTDAGSPDVFLTRDVTGAVVSTIATPTGAVVGDADAQTLTNKTIDGDNNTIQDVSLSSLKTVLADADKFVSRDVTGAAVSTKDVPTGDVVGDTDAQTLTNKTIDGTTNTLQNIPATAVDLAGATSLNLATSASNSTVNVGTNSGTNVINIGGSGTTINMAGTVNNNNVTNLNVADKLITINDGGGAGSAFDAGLEFEENGVITGYIKTDATRDFLVMKVPNKTGEVGITFSSTNDDVVLKELPQVINNKDIDGGVASNSHRITLPKDTLTNLQGLTRKAGTVVYATDIQKQYVDNGSDLVPVGTGGVTNYFPTGDAESGTTVTAYADGAAAPVDGQGGSPTLSVTTTTSSPLAGTKSFILTTGTLGDGVSILSDTIAVKDRGSMYVLELDLQRTTGGAGLTGEGEFGVFLLDVTNSNAPVTITPTHLVPALGLNPTKVKMFVQIPTNSAQLRLCLHQRASIGTSYDLKFEFSLTEQQFAGYAPIQTDWTQYTPSIVGFGTCSNIYLFYKQIGDTLKVKGQFQAGTVNGSTASISTPNNVKIDISKVFDITTNYSIIGSFGTTNSASQGFASADHFGGLVFNNTLTEINFISSVSGNTFDIKAGNQLIGNNQFVSIDFEVPIQGWSSESKVVSEYDGRVVAAKYFIASSVASSTTQPIDFATKSIDTHNAVTTGSNWKFTAPIAGIYKIGVAVATSTSLANILIYKNGTSNTLLGTATATAYAGGSQLIQLDAGDYIDVRLDASLSTFATTTQSISIELLSGAQQILAGQRIEASYWLSSNQAVNDSTPVEFDSKEFDTVSAVTLSPWKFNAPVSGAYLLTGYLSKAAGGDANMSIYKNGTVYKTLNYVLGADNNALASIIQLNAGDYIDIRPFTGLTTTVSGNASLSSNGASHIAIKQVN